MLQQIEGVPTEEVAAQIMTLQTISSHIGQWRVGLIWSTLSYKSFRSGAALVVRGGWTDLLAGVGDFLSALGVKRRILPNGFVGMVIGDRSLRIVLTHRRT